jgi:peroxiredoxin
MTLSRRELLSLLAAALLPTSARTETPPLIALPGNIPAPDFALPDLAGHVHTLADYRGRRLLISFWAVWCPPCRRELAALAELSARLRDAHIEVLAIDLGDSDERITAFLADHPAPNLPILLDRDRSVATAWHVQGLPCAYAVARTGTLKLGALGERDWLAPDIERQLRALP